MVIPNVKKVNLSDQLIENILQQIETGDWVEREKLPNELELAESFHVSRNVMREALKVLNSMNILDSHTGKGTFVSAGARENVFRMRCFEELRGDDSVEYVLESRIVIEPELAALACRRSTDEEIAELRAMVEKSIQTTATENNTLDFHLRLGQLSRNPLMSSFLSSLICTLGKGAYKTFREWATDIDLASLQDHLRIVEAMEMRDAELVKNLMYCHLKKRIDVIHFERGEKYAQ